MLALWLGGILLRCKTPYYFVKTIRFINLRKMTDANTKWTSVVDLLASKLNISEDNLCAKLRSGDDSTIQSAAKVISECKLYTLYRRKPLDFHTLQSTNNVWPSVGVYSVDNSNHARIDWHRLDKLECKRLNTDPPFVRTVLESLRWELNSTPERLDLEFDNPCKKYHAEQHLTSYCKCTKYMGKFDRYVSFKDFTNGDADTCTIYVKRQWDTLSDYFKERYGVDIRYPDYPLCFPMECLNLRA